MNGLSDVIADCYAALGRKADLKALEYCFYLDHLAMRIDEGAAGLFGVPGNESFKPEAVAARAERAFAALRLDPDRRDTLVRQWSATADAALPEVGR